MEHDLDKLHTALEEARETYNKARTECARDFASVVAWEYQGHRTETGQVDVVWFRPVEPLADPIGWATSLHMGGWHSDVCLNDMGSIELQFDDGAWTLAIFPEFITDPGSLREFFSHNGIVIHGLDKALEPWEKE